MRYVRLTATMLAASLLVHPAHVETTHITITNSGSTNASGYEITITPDGASIANDAGITTKMGVLPLDMTKKLFADAEAASPLAKMPVGHCAKSASFGTMTTIALGSDRSPDISCADDAKSAELFHDVQDVEKILEISARPRRHLMPVP